MSIPTERLSFTPAFPQLVLLLGLWRNRSYIPHIAGGINSNYLAVIF